MLTLPIVDLTNDSPAVQAETIRIALGSTGFFEVRNSGLDPETIERMFDLVCFLQSVPGGCAADAFSAE